MKKQQKESGKAENLAELLVTLPSIIP